MKELAQSAAVENGSSSAKTSPNPVPVRVIEAKIKSSTPKSPVPTRKTNTNEYLHSLSKTIEQFVDTIQSFSSTKNEPKTLEEAQKIIQEQSKMLRHSL